MLLFIDSLLLLLLFVSVLCEFYIWSLNCVAVVVKPV